LDIGTGGGEFLLTLGHPPENTYVTESWPPNATLCFERLTPLGIHVYELVDQSLYPFQDSSFDLVINRHASYNLDEISRILKPGGYFITQQVGSENNRLLSERLNPNAQPLYPNFSLKTAKPQINARGFEVLYSNEHYPEARYFDTGAIVYLAKVIEWEFPHFSVDRDFTQLLQLQRDIEHQGYILSREHRFVIVARKKNA
jgi:SAM-dependent methyltransferase